MDYKKRYKEWLEGDCFDKATRDELASIKDDDKEIEERFYKDLHFGTGGMRGIMGAGTNRMNKYTVGRAIKGLANYVLKKEQDNPSVVIAYDSRFLSQDFAEQAALLLCKQGISVYLFESLRPTPELSFAVRESKSTMGLMFTASHNPAKYNGFKVYWSDGAQVVSTIADELLEEIGKVTDFSAINDLGGSSIKDCKNLYMLGEDMDRRYIDRVKELAIKTDDIKGKEDFKIVYTPLHGAGNIPVRRVLDELGYKNVYVVEEQEKPDGSFPTVEFPNPEEAESLELALKLAKKIEGDLIIGTDPDCDRLGVMVRQKDGNYQRLSGNQAGALMVYHILETLERAGKLKEKSFFVDTIVTSKMAEKIAKSYGLDTASTLTGFKHIAVMIDYMEKQGGHFVFGFEESYGYLAGDFARDKDGVLAAMLICEMAAYYKSKGKTLIDVLFELFEKYGYFSEEVYSIVKEGKEGAEIIDSMMDYIRNNPLKEIDGVLLAETRDYLLDKTDIGSRKIPKENVLHFKFEDGSWFAIRPSGTEPKIKIYLSAEAEKKWKADERLKVLKDNVNRLLGDFS